MAGPCRRYKRHTMLDEVAAYLVLGPIAAIVLALVGGAAWSRHHDVAAVPVEKDTHFSD